jgi:predicted nucleic acid-binding protein
MGLLIDADTLVLWAADPAGLAAWGGGRGGEELHVSVITADELLRAADAAEQPGARARRRALVESLLELFPLLALDRATARAHAGLQLPAARRARLGASDRWLAATCLAHGLTLLTPRASHFEGIPGLACEGWPAS